MPLHIIGGPKLDFVPTKSLFLMSAQSQIRVAFGSVPKDAGTFTFYRNLRPALLGHGIDLRCVSLGRDDAHLCDADYVDEGCHLLVPRSSSLKRQARAFTDWCKRERIDIVMGINSAGILSALPHLPANIRVMSRCANAFDHGYRITMSGRERLMRIVALSPRLRDDLVADYGADPARIELIPNGIDPDRFDDAAARPRGQGEELELGFLGRLEHGQKGVLHIPSILDALHARKVPFRLRIAGKGRDGDQLRDALAAHEAAGRVAFLGALGPDQIPEFLAETDVFVFTSRFEGMPNALLEAMVAGCVPVCFNIKGITDFMIEQGQTGSLHDQGDAEALADTIADLARDRASLQAQHERGAQQARARFSNAKAAKAYAALFQALMQETPPAVEPRPWRHFQADPNFPQTWRRFIPPALKDVVRSGLYSASKRT
jgi:glycosyltransferase involved in cell wall biosynthesis